MWRHLLLVVVRIPASLSSAPETNVSSPLRVFTTVGYNNKMFLHYKLISIVTTQNDASRDFLSIDWPNYRLCRRWRQWQCRQAWFGIAQGDRPLRDFLARLCAKKIILKLILFQKWKRMLWLTSGDVVNRKEALSSIVQLSHPPVLIVAPQNLDDVILHERQFVGALCVVVVQGCHLQPHHNI